MTSYAMPCKHRFRASSKGTTFARSLNVGTTTANSRGDCVISKLSAIALLICDHDSTVRLAYTHRFCPAGKGLRPRNQGRSRQQYKSGQAGEKKTSLGLRHDMKHNQCK